MNRREALKATTALLGSVVALGACDREPRQAAKSTATTPPRVLSADDQALMEEIADTLLPTTAASPGARAANAGAEINLLLSDCYPAKDQQRVVQGLRDFRVKHAAFTSLPRADRERVLRALDAEAKKAGESHWFPLLRELSLRAYFSSEIGMTQALRYIRVPGKWVGCVARTPGQPAWG